MKMHRLFLLVCLFCSSVCASNTPHPTDKNVERLLDIGANDEAIRLLSDEIEKAEAKHIKVSPQSYFWRGKAALKIGWFSMARLDMQKVIASEHLPLHEQAKETLDELDKIEKALPPRVLEVTLSGKVIFRVYYFDKNPLTRLIIQSLPEAYKVNVALLKTDVVELPVFIFNTQNQLKAFHKARKTQSSGSWVWATGGASSFQFCLEKPDGTPVSLANPNYIRATVAHEYNHSVFSRAMGRVNIPKWFTEGLAQIAGGMVSPTDVIHNERTVFRLFKADMLIPMPLLKEGASFREHTEYGIAVGQISKATNREMVGPNAYAQSYHMTRYLLKNMETSHLVKFLNEVRKHRSFEKGFQTYFGADVEQFFYAWHAESSRQFK